MNIRKNKQKAIKYYRHNNVSMYFLRGKMAIINPGGGVTYGKEMA